ncbi:MAG: twin-arginine translocation signal domain-containing protein [Deltaproteobacteria bacterium]|nr:twin-arginine translocation signal domain-containing protein [Deltaproteobacteria bacterium]
MKPFTRRDFLRYSGIGGAAIFSAAWPLSMPVNAETGRCRKSS